MSCRKLDSSGYISVTESMHLTSTTDVIGPKATEFGEITQNNGQYAVEGYSALPLLVPAESLYATLYM